MKTFYKALINAFKNIDNKAKYTKAGLKPIQVIDLYNGQDFQPEYIDLVTLPALYISMNVDYSGEQPILALDFRLLYEQLRSTSNSSLSLDQALSFFDIADITDKIINSIETPVTGKLKKLAEGLELEPTVTDVYPLSYQCDYFGKTKTPQRETLQGEYDDVVIKANLFKSVL